MNVRNKKGDLVLDRGEFLVYQAENGRIKLEVHLKGETVWLTQKAMSELFDTSTDNISLHLKNIYAERELERNTTTEDFSVVQKEGGRVVRRLVKFYNLDAIISVGYRVKSITATRFRVWATQQLKEYIVKGFAMDDERLKTPSPEGSSLPDYFDEWLERIREIRASEKRFYQKVRDLYATAIDYDKKSKQAQAFFKKVQNKMLWSITGQTAAELISDRSDSKKANMGLTSWQGARVRKGDVAIAKNYLKEKEIQQLNRIVTMYLDYAEDQANRRNTMTMKQWSEKLDAFLEFNERDLLRHAGNVRATIAKQLAEKRYEEFEMERRRVEALEEDATDLKEIEGLVKRLESKREQR